MDKKKIIIAICIAIVAIATVVIALNQPEKSENTGSKETINEENSNVIKEEDTKDGNRQESSSFADNIKDVVSSDKNTSNSFFPHEIEKYKLEIRDIKSYDGIFFEDGKEQEAENIATIIVTNNSGVNIEYAKVILHGSQTDMEFKITALPKGGTMVVQELNMKNYVNQDYTDVTYEVAPLEKFEMSKDVLKVVEEDDQIKITNLTDMEVPEARVFFKLYMKDIDVYAGGITYTVSLKNIKAKETVYVAPYHYAPGNSKIMMVRTYDSEE